MRSPNCSSMTTTSPRAIGRPLTSRSTGLSARRSRVTTEPWPRLIVSPSDMWVRPTSTVSSTVTSVRRVRSASPNGPAGLASGCSGRGVNSTSVMSWLLLDREVGDDEVLGLDVGLLVDPVEDLFLDLDARLLARQARRGHVGDRVGDDPAHRGLLGQRAVAVGRRGRLVAAAGLGDGLLEVALLEHERRVELGEAPGQIGRA